MIYDPESQLDNTHKRRLLIVTQYTLIALFLIVLMLSAYSEMRKFKVHTKLAAATTSAGIAGREERLYISSQRMS